MSQHKLPNWLAVVLVAMHQLLRTGLSSLPSKLPLAYPRDGVPDASTWCIVADARVKVGRELPLESGSGPGRVTGCLSFHKARLCVAHSSNYNTHSIVTITWQSREHIVCQHALRVSGGTPQARESLETKANDLRQGVTVHCHCSHFAGLSQKKL